MMKFFEGLDELDRLGVEENTNKASSWRNPAGETINKEGMLKRYDFFLSRLRAQGMTRMLELGAGPDGNIGASVRMWKRYFPKECEIHVADNKPSAKKLDEEGFHTHVGDLGQQPFLNRLANGGWDFVIDDASHLWIHQIMAFRTLFPALHSGGIYICEDLCTSFGAMRAPYSMGFDMRDPVQFFLALSRAACGSPGSSPELISELYALTEADHGMARQIHMISWIKNSVIIVKK